MKRHIRQISSRRPAVAQSSLEVKIDFLQVLISRGMELVFGLVDLNPPG